MATLTPPKDLDKTAKAAWRDLVRQNDHLTPQDAPLLRVYAVAVSMLRRAEDQLDRDGITVKTHRGFGKHPAATIAHEAGQRIIRVLRELRCAATTRKATGTRPTKTDGPKLARFKVS